MLMWRCLLFYTQQISFCNINLLCDYTPLYQVLNIFCSINFLLQNSYACKLHLQKNRILDIKVIFGVMQKLFSLTTRKKLFQISSAELVIQLLILSSSMDILQYVAMGFPFQSRIMTLLATGDSWQSIEHKLILSFFITPLKRSILQHE